MRVSRFENVLMRIVLAIVLLIPTCVLADLPSDKKDETSTLSETNKEKSSLNMNRKKFLEFRAGSWKVAPGLALKFGSGYAFSIGPKITIRRNFSDIDSINFSFQYLPLSINDIPGDGRIDLYSASSIYRNYFRARFFYELGFGLNSFKPGDEIQKYVSRQGGNITDGTKINGSVSLAYQLFQVPYSYKSKKRKLPFYLKLTWREGEEYSFAADLGRAGSEYRSQKKGLSVRLYPMFRRF